METDSTIVSRYSQGWYAFVGKCTRLVLVCSPKHVNYLVLMYTS